ncbi:MAG: hypothetical protein R2764_24475 [Bacteroidales bacterium]
MPEESLISGYAEVLDFTMEDRNDKRFMGMDKLECIIQKADVNNLFIIDSLIITKPYVYFELDSSSNNLSEIFIGQNEYPDSTQTTVITEDTIDSQDPYPVYYAVNFMQIIKGEIDCY